MTSETEGTATNHPSKLMWVPGSQEWKPIVEPCVHVWRADDPDASDAVAFDMDDIEEAVTEWCHKYWESGDYEGGHETFCARYGDGPIVEVRVDIDWDPIFSARVVTETEPNSP